jgi:capsular polysaccharide transport system permease protein
MARAVSSFTANSSLMYHRQIKVLDLILVRFGIELVGHMMAYLFVAVTLYQFGLFPWPHDLGFMLLGWAYYALFTFAVVLVIAPLSEMSEAVEKFIPVTTYLMVPFSGAFYFVGSLFEDVTTVVLYSPPVHGMEMMRYGVFGPSIDPQYDFVYPLSISLPLILLGLIMTRIVRRRLVIE